MSAPPLRCQWWTEGGTVDRQSARGVVFDVVFDLSLSLSKFFKNVQFYMCVCAHAHVRAVTCIWRSMQLVEVDFHHVKSMGLIQIATSTM